MKYFEKLLPDIYECLMKIKDALGTDKEQEVLNEIYPVIPKISIDYGIMERADNVLMLEGDFGWNDVGSWDALDNVFDRDEDGLDESYQKIDLLLYLNFHQNFRYNIFQ